MTTPAVDAPQNRVDTREPSPRSLTPDVARGLGMAGVILVNATMMTVVEVRTQVDAWVEFAITLLLEGRSWPVFALMFGWGLTASAASLQRRGLTRGVALRTLRRRGGWLIAFGFVQSLLWFNLDILGVYGLTAVVLAVAVFWSSRALAGLAGLALVPWAAVTAAAMLGEPEVEGWEATTYLAALVERVALFLAGMTLATLALAVVPPLVLGIVLFRRGSLHRPGDHRRLHRRVAGWGLLLGLAGGVPWSLVDSGWWDADTAQGAGALFLHLLTGMAQGAAYVSLIALAVAGPGERSSGVVRALVAIGQRSLTVYLLHAVLLSFTLAPWALDFTTQLSLAQTYAWALAVWCLCAAVALALHAAGRTGPAEALLRRLVERRVPRVAATPSHLS